VIVEAVDRSARNDEALAGAELDFVAGDGEGEGAFEAVGGLLVAVVAVGAGNLAAGVSSNSNMARVPLDSWPSTR
jgi:hypothetical protein